MDYVIKIGRNFIGLDSGGRYTEVTNYSKAIRGDMHKLSNIINNSISPNKRSKCKIVLASSVKVVPVPTPKPLTVTKPVDSLFDSVFESLKKVDTTDFNREQGILSQKLSAIDQEICDIQHYIEFNKLNAAEGYKAFKMLQDKLLERRVIKNDFAKFQMLNDAKVSEIFDGTLDSKLSAMEKKKYTPRVLKELFERND